MGPVNWPKVVDDASREQLHQDGGMMERLCCSVSFRQGYRRQESAVWSSRAWYRSATFPLLADLSSISLSAWISKDPAALALCPTLCFPQWAVLLQLAELLAGRTRPLLIQRRSVALLISKSDKFKVSMPHQPQRQPKSVITSEVEWEELYPMWSKCNVNWLPSSRQQ